MANNKLDAINFCKILDMFGQDAAYRLSSGYAVLLSVQMDSKVWY